VLGPERGRQGQRRRGPSETTPRPSDADVPDPSTCVVTRAIGRGGRDSHVFSVKGGAKVTITGAPPTQGSSHRQVAARSAVVRAQAGARSESRGLAGSKKQGANAKGGVKLQRQRSGQMGVRQPRTRPRSCPVVANKARDAALGHPTPDHGTSKAGSSASARTTTPRRWIFGLEAGRES